MNFGVIVCLLYANLFAYMVVVVIAYRDVQVDDERAFGKYCKEDK